MSVYTADFDRDGDMDVLSASLDAPKIAWYENVDGEGTFGDQQVITTEAFGAMSLHPADLDGDGDVDVLSRISDGDIVWYEQFELAPGDANRDAQFNQFDIVDVLQAGKYLTAQSATWSEGDFNGDGVFDQADLIAALQTGSYLHRP